MAVLAQRLTDAERKATADLPDAAAIRMLRVVDQESVKTATRLLMIGELSKHAISEGSKAVTSWIEAQCSAKNAKTEQQKERGKNDSQPKPEDRNQDQNF